MSLERCVQCNNEQPISSFVDSNSQICVSCSNYRTERLYSRKFSTAPPATRFSARLRSKQAIPSVATCSSAPSSSAPSRSDPSPSLPVTDVQPRITGMNMADATSESVSSLCNRLEDRLDRLKEQLDKLSNSLVVASPAVSTASALQPVSVATMHPASSGAALQDPNTSQVDSQLSFIISCFYWFHAKSSI